MFRRNSSNGEEDNGVIPERQMLPFLGAVKEEKKKKKKKKKLLVLSLGGLLCHRACIKRPSSLLRNRTPDASYGSIVVYKRPHSEDFVSFCLERFEVAIWSSAREWYLNNALDCVMGPLRRKLLFSWDQSQCTKSEFNTLENKDKPIFFKELSKIWANYADFSASNTLLIDDKPYKAILNPVIIFFYILEGLAEAEDIGAYVKTHPFRNPAITPSHPDWAYYSRIITAHSHSIAT